MDYWGVGGGAKGYVGPPSQIIWGAWPPPLPTPMIHTTFPALSIFQLSMLVQSCDSVHVDETYRIYPAIRRGFYSSRMTSNY